jgi:hypothetical protein
MPWSCSSGGVSMSNRGRGWGPPVKWASSNHRPAAGPPSNQRLVVGSWCIVPIVIFSHSIAIRIHFCDFLRLRCAHAARDRGRMRTHNQIGLSWRPRATTPMRMPTKKRPPDNAAGSPTDALGSAALGALILIHNCRSLWKMRMTEAGCSSTVVRSALCKI